MDTVATLSLSLSEEEVFELIGYEQPATQVKRMRELGFWLTWRHLKSGRCIVPRAHYLAVCAGARPQESTAPADAPRPKVKPPSWQPRVKRDANALPATQPSAKGGAKP